MTDSKGLTSERPGFVELPAYMGLPHNPSTWLIKNLIPLSGAALIYGLPKTGKSALAIQMALAITNGDKEWLGFPIVTRGRVLYLQLDQPRSTWRLRFAALLEAGVDISAHNLFLADRECLSYFPFDISKQIPHDHMAYLYSIVQPLHPVAVIIDTLRKVHSQDEDSSTSMSNVVSRLIGAVHPASLILVSHSRKPTQDSGHDLMNDHRGSGSVTGEMDAVMKLTKTRLYLGGRNIEEDSLKLERQDVDGCLLWKVRQDSDQDALLKVLIDKDLATLRAKARKLAPIIGKSEEGCLSMVRRAYEKLRTQGTASQTPLLESQLGTGVTQQNDTEGGSRNSL